MYTSVPRHRNCPYIIGAVPVHELVPIHVRGWYYSCTGSATIFCSFSALPTNFDVNLSPYFALYHPSVSRVLRTHVSTQVQKLPGPEWDVPICGQVPELVWDFSYGQVPELVWDVSYRDVGLILFFSLSQTVRSSEIPLTPYIVLQLAIKTMVRKPNIILVLTAMGSNQSRTGTKQL